MNTLPRLFFAHANGFTPEAYAPVLHPLADRYRVVAPALRPLRHGTAPTGDWNEIADDLATLVDAEPSPALGMGHSLGAVALLMLAAARPSRFSRLVLIEPPAIAAWGAAVLRIAPAAIRSKSPMAAATRRRTDTWASFEQAFAHERARRWYAQVDDTVLEHLLRHGLEHDGSAWRPRFHKEWEARLYETPTSIWPLLACPALPPITVVRGADSAVFSASDLARWRRLRPQDCTIEVPATGHLLPFERPDLPATWG